MLTRRHFLSTAAGALVLAGPGRAAAPRMEVFKTPTCGCCGAWIAHVERAGIGVTARDVTQEALWAAKQAAGLTAELASCHTGFIAGYVVEGHVPAADIRRLLSARPEAIGLAVPGMPIGSPGMEMGDRREAFDTLLVRHDGATEIFARHG